MKPVIRTFQMRLPGDRPALALMAQTYQRAMRTLYAESKRTGKSFDSLKTEYCRRFGVSGRQFNAIKTDLAGKVSSVREKAAYDLEAAEEALATTLDSIAKADEAKKTARAERAEQRAVAEAKIRRQSERKVHLSRKRQRLEAKTARLRKTIAASHPPMCYRIGELHRRRWSMGIDARTVNELFTALGAALARPTTLCLIGSTPAILSGQDERQTSDFDVWHPVSEYDAGSLRTACEAVGILFDPRDDVGADTIYLQVVRPGIVSLPDDFRGEVLARFGNLTLVMPPAEIIAAAKLVRGSDVDLEDVVWWVQSKGLDQSDIEHAIERLPRERDRETARENLVLIALVSTREPK